jgi:hypothetical protein
MEKVSYKVSFGLILPFTLKYPHLSLIFVKSIVNPSFTLNQYTMLTPKIERNITLNHSTDEVKKSIHTLLHEHKYKVKFNYVVNEEIQNMGYYRLGKVKGIIANTFSVTLKEVGDNQTSINIECLTNPNNVNVSNSIVDDFLLRVSAISDGKGDELLLSSKGSNGCMLIVIGFILFFSLNTLFNI